MLFWRPHLAAAVLIPVGLSDSLMRKGEADVSGPALRLQAVSVFHLSSYLVQHVVVL